MKSEVKKSVKKSETKKTKNVRKPAERVEIAPNIFRASPTSLYIKVGGVMKYCIQSRFEKLLAKVDGDYGRLVAEYRSKAPKAVEVEQKAAQ